MKEAIQYFWNYLKRYKFKLSIVMIAVIASMYFVVRTPEFSGQAINALGQYLFAGADKAGFYDVVKVMFLFAVLSWLFNSIQNVLMTKVAGDVTDDMRKDLFAKIERLPISFFDKSNDGDILSRFTSDLDNISNSLNQSIHEIITNIVMLVISVIMMFGQNMELTWVLLSIIPVLVAVASIIIIQAKKSMTLQQKRVGELNGFADERFSGQKVIIANGLQEETKVLFQEYDQKLYDATYKAQLYSNMLFPVLQGLSMVANAVVVFYGAWMTLEGRLPLAEAAGTLFLYTQYVRMVFQPLSQIASQYTQMQLAFTGANRIVEILNEEDEVDHEGVVSIDGIVGEVTIKDISFAYDEDTNVLNNISFNAAKGEMVALVGHTGSGKTTIMNLLNRFYNVDSGAIEFDGRNINDISLPSLRANVGIVLQDSVLFTGTVADNIAFGKPDATLEEITHVAKRTHIHDFIMSLEHGYETLVSEDNSKMSVGQKQLISIARTMLIDPDLLILDEATSNVDTVTEHQIQAAMDQVTQGRTSFVIAHRLKTILEADRIIVLSHGSIIEEGTHQELLDSDGHYAELYKNQFSFES